MCELGPKAAVIHEVSELGLDAAVVCELGPDAAVGHKVSELGQDAAVGHNRHDPKIGAVPLSAGRTPSNTMWPGQRPTSIPSGILNLDLSSHLATIETSAKSGGWGVLCPLLGGARSPSNTMLLQPRPISVST